MTQDLSVLRAGCRWQRELCANNWSPTYVALIDGLLDRLGVDEVVTGLLTDDGQDPIRSALCLRLFGAVNRLAQATPNCGLTDFYPTYGGEVDLDRVVEEFFGFVTGNAAAVAAELPTPVQTNDVGRVVPLAAAMAYVTAVTGLPLRPLEVGASAGLNLLLDHYRVEADGASWGPADSPLNLDGKFELGTPPVDTPVISERRTPPVRPPDSPVGCGNRRTQTPGVGVHGAQRRGRRQSPAHLRTLANGQAGGAGHDDTPRFSSAVGPERSTRSRREPGCRSRTRLRRLSLTMEERGQVESAVADPTLLERWMPARA